MEFIGQIGMSLCFNGFVCEICVEFLEIVNDRSAVYEFVNLSKILSSPGDLTENTSLDFMFPNVEKAFESYLGTNVKLRYLFNDRLEIIVLLVRCRYFLRLVIIKRFSNLTYERDICVQQIAEYPEMNNSLKMEVGIEDALHIEFEYNKSKYHLKDVIVGKINFLLVRIKIKHMEISIIKRESSGNGGNAYTENETIAKYEIMDGAPVRGNEKK